MTFRQAGRIMGPASPNRRTAELPPQGSIDYSYDTAGRRQSMQASDLLPVSYGYDANSRLTSM